MKLKAYFWKPYKDSDTGIAIVAPNLKQAKVMGWAFWGSDVGNDDEYIEQHCKWIKDANIEGIEEPTVIDDIDGLRRNIYGWIEDAPCDICGHDNMLYHCEGKALCNDCIEGVE